MMTFLLIVHVVVCVFMVIVILLQHGKGADMGATFGGSSQTVFGAGGATTVLSKITIGAAIVFMCTSISLAYLSSSGSSKSIMEGEKGKPAATPTVVAPQGSPVPTAVPTVAAPTPAPTPTAKKHRAKK